MLVRTRRTLRPVMRCRPVMRPSRGPGPSWLPMYIAPPMALTSRPTAKSAERATMEFGSETSAIVASSTKPSHTAFATVPRPGH